MKQVFSFKSYADLWTMFSEKMAEKALVELVLSSTYTPGVLPTALLSVSFVNFRQRLHGSSGRESLTYHTTIDDKSRTIVIKGTGRGTTADTLRLIAQNEQNFRQHAGFNLLYDSSEMEIDSNPGDMLKVATALFENSPTTFGRVAVVVPESRAGLASIFTALAHPHGVNANVFTNVADARRWLGIDR